MANAPILFRVKDNAASQLTSGIASNGLSIPLTGGTGALFPQPYHSTCTSLGTASTLNCTGISATIGGSAQVGKPIRNYTDGSWAFITAVATDAVTTTALQGGTLNLWSNADEWRIDEFILTIESHDASVPYNVTAREKVLIYGRSTDTLSVKQAGDRGYDGSTAQAWLTNDYVYLHVVSLSVQKIIEQLSEIHRLSDSSISTIAAILKSTPYYAADTGAADAYVVTLSPVPAAYTTGMVVRFKAANTNTTTSTVNVNGLGTKTIKRLGGTTDMSVGDIASGQMITIVYDGTNFQMVNPSAVDPLSSLGNGPYGSAALGNVTFDGTTATSGGNYTRVDSTHYRLDSDCNFGSLTLDSGIDLNPNGYKFRCTTTFTQNGTVTANGGTGGNGNTGVGNNGGSNTAVVGTAGAAGTTGGSLPNAKAGGVGGTGGNSGSPGGTGQSGGAGASNSETVGYGSNGVAGGAGGAGGNAGPSPGSGGSSSGGTTSITAYDNMLNTQRLTGLVTQNITCGWNSGSGGGGGGGGGSGAASDNGAGGGGSGGGAGGNGGNFFCVVKTWAGNGTYNFNGGNGGNGGNGLSKNNTNGGGGGGGGTGAGGNGGFIVHAYKTKTFSGTINVAGGTKGATVGTAGTGDSPSAGNLGTDGVVGKSLEIILAS